MIEQPEPIEFDGEICRLTLPSTLTIAEVSSFAANFAEHDGEPKILKIDASIVTQIDLAGLQMLLAIINEAGERGCSVSWPGITDHVRDSAALAGLLDKLYISH